MPQRNQNSDRGGSLLSSHAVIATDLKGTITFWNSGAEALYGWKSEEVLGRNILDVTPSNLSRDDAAAIMAKLVRGETWSGEFEVRKRDGTVFRAYITDSPTYNADGELSGVVGSSVDVRSLANPDPGGR